MKRELPVLDRIHVAKPCPADWDSMVGDDRVRHCSQCRLNVYNFSEMSRDEAEKLVREREGRLCAQFYRREDGTIITRDCPKGLAAFRRRVARRAVLAFSMVLSAIGCGKVGDQLKEDFGVAKYLPPSAPPPVFVRGRVAVITYAPAAPKKKP